MNRKREREEIKLPKWFDSEAAGYAFDRYAEAERKVYSEGGREIVALSAPEYEECGYYVTVADTKEHHLYETSSLLDSIAESVADDAYASCAETILMNGKLVVFAIVEKDLAKYRKVMLRAAKAVEKMLDTIVRVNENENVEFGRDAYSDLTVTITYPGFYVYGHSEDYYGNHRDAVLRVIMENVEARLETVKKGWNVISVEWSVNNESELVLTLSDDPAENLKVAEFLLSDKAQEIIRRECDVELDYVNALCCWYDNSWIDEALNSEKPAECLKSNFEWFKEAWERYGEDLSVDDFEQAMYLSEEQAEAKEIVNKAIFALKLKYGK